VATPLQSENVISLSQVAPSVADFRNKPRPPIHSTHAVYFQYDQTSHRPASTFDPHCMRQNLFQPLHRGGVCHSDARSRKWSGRPDRTPSTCIRRNSTSTSTYVGPEACDVSGPRTHIRTHCLQWINDKPAFQSVAATRLLFPTFHPLAGHVHSRASKRVHPTASPRLRWSADPVRQVRRKRRLQT